MPPRLKQGGPICNRGEAATQLRARRPCEYCTKERICIRRSAAQYCSRDSQGAIAMARSSLTVKPIAGALGAEIHGIDLSEPLDDIAFRQIHQVLLDHCVIFFRDQHLTPDQPVACSHKTGRFHASSDIIRSTFSVRSPAAARLGRAGTARRAVGAKTGFFPHSGRPVGLGRFFRLFHRTRASARWRAWRTIPRRIRMLPRTT